MTIFERNYSTKRDKKYHRYIWVCSISWHDLEINNEDTSTTKLYYKRDEFSFPIVNFVLLGSSIPVASLYEEFLYDTNCLILTFYFPIKIFLIQGCCYQGLNVWLLFICTVVLSFYFNMPSISIMSFYSKSNSTVLYARYFK